MKRTLLLVTLLLATLFCLEGQTRSRVVLQIDGSYYWVDTLRDGQDYLDLALLYALDPADIEAANAGLNIAAGKPLRIPCNKRMTSLAPRRDDDNNFRYRVRDGDTAFSVAVANALSMDVMVEDNPGIDITDISNLRYINIRLSETGKTQTPILVEQSARYAALLNVLSHDNEYFTVEPSQTLYSLSRANEIAVDRFASLNGNPAVLSIGMMMKIPRREPIEFVAPEPKALPTDMQTEIVETVAAAEFDGGVLNVAMLLPLTDGENAIRGSFVEFFNGALLAAQDLKAEGRSIELNLFDTQNDEATVDSLVRSGTLDGISLIIGPVYERNMAPVARYASERGIPLISPLAAVDGQWGGNFYQMAPVPRDKYLKMHDVVQPETNVIYIYTSTTDMELEREMGILMGEHPISDVVFTDDFAIDSLVSRPIEDVMMRDDNLFVVLSDTEIEVDRTLAIISSIMNSRQPRYPNRRVPIRILGSSKWTRYRNLDKNLLFKLDVSYAANYHADRSNSAVRLFDRRYARAFGRMPSLYAYRAYDALKLFGQAMYGTEGTLTERVNAMGAPLQTHYNFELLDGSMRNTEWGAVNYAPTYNIVTR